MKKYLKRIKRKIKYNRKANNILLFVFVMLLFMGVGYAYLNATLSITGTGKVTKTTWDVHFENIQPIDGSVSPTSAPVISNDTTVSFSATLNEPGDFYSFYVDLVNAGTIDASIGSLNITPTLTSEQQEYFEYRIKYKGDNSLDVQEGDALSHGDTKTIEILFRYKELDNHDLYPDEDVTFNFSITVNSMQATYNKEESVLRTSNVNDRYAYKSNTYREKIKTITFDDHINPPSGYIESWDVSEGSNGNVMAYIVTNSEDNTKYDLYIQGNGHLYAPEDSKYLFYGFTATDKIYNLSLLDTSQVVNMQSVFSRLGYNSNSEINLDLSNWNTSNVTNMGALFSSVGYYSPTVNINISNWDTSNVVTMEEMFFYSGYWAATTWNVVGLSDLNTSKVTNMMEMFYGVGGYATILNLDLSNWDTSNVTDMRTMFGDAGHRANTVIVDIGGWNTSKLEYFSDIFNLLGRYSNSLTVIIPRTNGNGLNNTTTRFYGKNESLYVEASGNLIFTLASS